MMIIVSQMSEKIITSKIHYGHYTLGLRGLCGREVKCEQLTRDEKKVTCKKCLDAIFR